MPLSDITRNAPEAPSSGEGRTTASHVSITAGAVAQPARGAKPRRAESAIAAGVYLLLVVLYLGRRALRDPSSGTLGTGPDVQIFLWGLRWWPYALGHGVNPLFTRLVWPPGGVDVLWTTTIPALSLLMAPVTLTLGAAASWNLLCVLAPAVSGWAAWLLCRELGSGRWPSLLGGALFGFSSFEVAEGIAHLQLTMSALIPVAAFCVVRHLFGRLSGRGLVLRLTAVTVVQFLISPEVLVTALMMATVAGGAAILVIADCRAAILRTAGLAAAGVAAGCVVLTPLLISMVTHSPAQLSAQVGYPADLLNLVIPTPITALGGGWAQSITARYPGNLAEQCAYMGIPMVAIIIAFAIRERASQPARLLIAVLIASVICSLGPQLTIDGHPSIWMPWALIDHLPFVSDALPARFALYTALTATVITARWLSDQTRRSVPGRWLLAILAAVSIAPSAAAAYWQPTPTTITTPALDRLLDHQRVLSLPFFNVADRGLYAQAAGDMHFSLIDNWLQLRPRDFNQYLRGPRLAPRGLARLHGESARRFRRQLCEAHITRLLVWSTDSRLLAGLQIHPQKVGDTLIYGLPSCRSSRRR